MKNKIINNWQELNKQFKDFLSDKKNKKLIAIILIFGIVFGILLSNIFTTSVSEQELERAKHDHVHKVQQHKNHVSKETRYTCSMHPQINKGKPGKCPICGMTLIPIDEGEEIEDTSSYTSFIKKYTVKLSKAALKIAEVQTTPVIRKILSEKIKLVGKIDFDETRLANMTAWFPGRIEKMYVDYTGIKVNKGDHLVTIYSPELLSAQEELLSAKRAIRRTSKSNYSGIKKLTRATLVDVRRKLKLWGMTDKQIKRIERNKKTSRTMTIYSPVNGVVIKKSVNEGMYVKTGSNLYSIADLDHLWVKLDAYESDISKIRFGQSVIFYAESYPGQKFKGKVSFIDPVLDKKTQSIKIRVNVQNSEGLLRPGMFVHAVVMAKVSNTGVIIDQSMAGKFTCRMHPEVIKEKKGSCPICGMDLVSASSLGYHTHQNVNSQDDENKPLIIPATAPLLTGERAVVYISLGEGKFDGRVVTLGTKVGNFYIVKSGLKEGDEVVTNGNFKIDSAAQIQAKPSMMNPTGGGPAMSGHANHNMGGSKKHKKMNMSTPKLKSDNSSSMEHSKMSTNKTKVLPVNKFITSLDDIYNLYLNIHKDLANDNISNILSYTTKIKSKLLKIDMSLLKGELHMKWMKLLPKFNKNLELIEKAKDIKEVRNHFQNFSGNIISLKENFGSSKSINLKKFYCPMVNSFWMQIEEGTLNPYYGQSMLTCGEQK